MQYVIVGAGLFGSVIARQLTDAGKRVVVIDQRDHVGGNCSTMDQGGINVHMYGPHIFHTSDQSVWDYLNKHTTVNNFRCTPKIKVGNRLFSFPINLMTFNQLWGISTPIEARRYLKNVVWKIHDPQNAMEWAMSNVGSELYSMFYKGYLEKQWGRSAMDIPASVIARQVVRLNYNDSYYYDTFQGVPDYTRLFESLLDGVDVRLNEKFEGAKGQLIYSGRIDEFYGFKHGTLEYRSLRFEHTTLPMDDYQGVFMVSYPDPDREFTRIIEHKHFEFGEQEHTIITKEYPTEFTEDRIPFYPVGGERNAKIYNKYLNNDGVIFGGRLGSYKYMNMDQTIKQALEVSKTIIDG